MASLKVLSYHEGKKKHRGGKVCRAQINQRTTTLAFTRVVAIMGLDFHGARWRAGWIPMQASAADKL